MDTLALIEKKPHVIFIPLPAQSHMKMLLKLAELLNQKGIHITFVNTEFIHKRLLDSGCLDGSSSFRFETIPDGIPRTSEDDDGSEFILDSIETNFLGPFIDLANRLPTRPTCIISDGFMSSFTIDAAQKLGIPIMLYWTFSACGFMGFYEIESFIEKGITPLKDESYLTNGYLETTIDWIPGMKGIRLRDLHSIVQTLDPTDRTFTFVKKATEMAHKVSHTIMHTFNDLEANVVDALSSIFPHFYTVGPLQFLLNQTTEEDQKPLNFNGYSLWKEESECFHWLQTKEPKSVLYVNFGSLVVMSLEDLIEFGWGLVNSNHYFLWIIRPNFVVGESVVLPRELEERIKDRGFIGRWCSQEKVLNHPSIGGFLTHGGWGSTIESLSAGVPMICLPFLWDQMTNCRYICKEWEVGLELGKNTKRDEVEKTVVELMGDRGQKMRNKAMEWKEKALIATGPGGSSSLNVEKLVKEIIMLSS